MGTSSGNGGAVIPGIVLARLQDLKYLLGLAGVVYVQHSVYLTLYRGEPPRTQRHGKFE